MGGTMAGSGVPGPSKGGTYQAGGLTLPTKNPPLDQIGPTFNQLNPNFAPNIAKQMNPLNPGYAPIQPSAPPVNPGNGPTGGTDIPPPFLPPIIKAPVQQAPPPPPAYVPHATVAAGPTNLGQNPQSQPLWGPMAAANFKGNYA